MKGDKVISRGGTNDLKIFKGGNVPRVPGWFLRLCAVDDRQEQTSIDHHQQNSAIHIDENNIVNEPKRIMFLIIIMREICEFYRTPLHCKYQ